MTTRREELLRLREWILHEMPRGDGPHRKICWEHLTDIDEELRKLDECERLRSKDS